MLSSILWSLSGLLTSLHQMADTLVDSVAVEIVLGVHCHPVVAVDTDQVDIVLVRTENNPADSDMAYLEAWHKWTG